jgi:hypothetical protein
VENNKTIESLIFEAFGTQIFIFEVALILKGCPKDNKKYVD